MSHEINDQIADIAMAGVDALNDHQVLQVLYYNHGIASPIDGDGFDGEAYMEAKRNKLVELVYSNMMERPGPHGWSI